MENYDFLLWLAIIMLSTKLFGLVTEKVHLPQVVGALLAGVILGPSGFGILHETDFLTKTSEIGVIMLMFIAGLDTDVEELKHTGPKACIIAALGVIVPMLLTGGAYYLFFADAFTSENILRACFLGVVFAATSVSITVETLTEMGKVKTHLGATLISAALIDDIIGIVVLSVITGFSDSSVNSLMVLAKIGAFFVFTGVVGAVIYLLFKDISIHHGRSRRIAIWALAFAFLMAYAAETWFGVADITGSYFAGVILCNITKSRQFLAKKMTVASYLVFSPVFFASIGLKTDLHSLTTNIIMFALVLLVLAIISKIIGCGLGAKLCGMSNYESLNIGIGMVARGEVALMVAQKGINAGMIDNNVLPAIVLVVVCAALLTPVLLKFGLGRTQLKGGENA